MLKHRVVFRGSDLLRFSLLFAVLTLPVLVHANNPGVSPQMILLQKECPGPSCDQDCQWTGGAGGDIVGTVKIDEASDVEITKIEMRSAGAQNWNDVTNNFTITMNGFDPTTAEGDIYWEDANNNNVPVGCSLAVDKFVELQVTTSWTPQGGQPIIRVWFLSVTMRMFCDRCDTGEASARTSGDQCHAPQTFDRDLRTTLSVMNQTTVPQLAELVLTDDAGWSVQPALPAFVNLLPGEIATFPVLVTLPGGTPAGFTNTFTLLANFSGANLASSNTTSMTFTVDEACAPLLVSSSAVPALGRAALLLLGGLLGLLSLLAVLRHVRS